MSLALGIPPHELQHQDLQDLVFDAIVLGILTTEEQAKEIEIQNLAMINPAYRRILQRMRYADAKKTEKA